MDLILLLLPDFLLILLGFLLFHVTKLDRSIWVSGEKIIYYVMFPALLFNSINQTTFDWSGTSRMLLVSGLAFGSAICLGFLSRFLAKDLRTWASGFQTAFRFNSYFALAAASSIFGQNGVALMALTIGCFTPIANALAVYTLAKHSDIHPFKEMARNPLIIATIAGLITNLLNLHLPEYIGLTISRLNIATIALGLLTVGAGLVWIQSKRDGLLITYWTLVKLIATPAIALSAARHFELPAAQIYNTVLFAAMPTATSSFVLASRMNGNGAIVAASISIMTLLATFTIPFWLIVAV